MVTLVDSTRNMLVLQDATGAMALRPIPSGVSVQPGQRVSLKASACSTYIASLPDYPFQPSGRDTRPLFEAPGNEGNFRLTRMRGWLRPPTTGNYTFWISSDDSSELWLSTGAIGPVFPPDDPRPCLCARKNPTISGRFRSSDWNKAIWLSRGRDRA